MFKMIAELSQQLGTEKFSLLMNMIDDDMNFYKSIGTEYNEEKIINLINNSMYSMYSGLKSIFMKLNVYKAIITSKISWS